MSNVGEDPGMDTPSRPHPEADLYVSRPSEVVVVSKQTKELAEVGQARPTTLGTGWSSRYLASLHIYTPGAEMF